MTHVLIVEDAPDAAELATAVMRGAGFDTSVAATAAAAEELTPRAAPRRDPAGPRPARRRRHRPVSPLREFSDAYIVMLTSRDDEIDKVLGLKLGRGRLRDQAVLPARGPGPRRGAAAPARASATPGRARRAPGRGPGGATRSRTGSRSTASRSS